MNQVIEALEQRRSCRSYTDQPVDPKKLEQIVEAGLWAASGMGRQGTHLVVVTNPDDVAALSRMNAQIMGSTNDPFYGARAVIVVLTNPENPTCVEDGALVMGNLMNAAHALGVASCWIHRAKEEFESDEAKPCSPSGASRAPGAALATASWATPRKAASRRAPSVSPAASPTSSSSEYGASASPRHV